MNRVPTAVRKERRATAPLALQRLRDKHGVRYRINDPKCAHATVWVSQGHRIEWWPATGRWHDRKGKHFGEANDFVAYVRAASANPITQQRTSDLIDEVDTAALRMEAA